MSSPVTPQEVRVPVYVTATELAQVLRVSRKTVTRMLKRNVISKVPGIGKLRFDLEKVVEALDGTATCASDE